MIDLKDFTIDELISIYLADPADGEPREMTNREYDADRLAVDIAAEYLKRIKERKIIELPIPLYSVVYAVTYERAFNHESGKEPLCENQFECREDCELNGKECKIMPFIEQKIYVPNSIWFDYITNNWGTEVFGTLKEAVRRINDKYGEDFCIENGLPVIDDNGEVRIPGFEADSDLIKAYNAETFGSPVIPKVQNDTLTDTDKNN